MARFIKATSLPMKWRRPHINRYRTQLRDALMNPALTPEQRDMLKARLDALGKEKPYAELAARATGMTGDSTSSVGSSPTTPTATTVDELLDHTKDELLTIAEDESVEVFPSWTKTQIAEAILASRT